MRQRESGAGGESCGGDRRSEEGWAGIRVRVGQQSVVRGGGPRVGKPSRRRALAGSQMREKETKTFLKTHISALKLA